MVDAILILGLVVVLGAAMAYIIKAKKNGECIGCPAAKTCSGKCSGNCSGCGGTCSDRTNNE